MANDSLGKFKKLQAETQALISGAAVPVPGEASPLHHFAHFWVMTAQSFVRNRCPVRASALAYASLLALVPMLAVVVSVSSSLLKTQGEKPIDDFIKYVVEQMVGEASTMKSGPHLAANDANLVAAREDAVKKIKGAIDNVRSGALGITGMVALMFVAISMLARIEETLNDIWGITRGRSWFARIVHYWAALTLGPLLLMVALGLNIGARVQFIGRLIGPNNIPGQMLLQWSGQLLPLLLLCLAFALFYQVMPNTRVQWKASLVGGLVGGTLWHLNNVLSVLYVSRVVTNSKIYGSLGMIPVFMIGLYFSWSILLFGAQVAYAWQNRAAYAQDRLAEAATQQDRELLALRIMTRAGQRFLTGEKAPTAIELAKALAVPSKLIGLTLQPLVASQLVVELAGTEMRYTPARPPERINLHQILQAMRAGKGGELPTSEGPERAAVQAEFQRIAQAEREVAENTTLAALVAVRGREGLTRLPRRVET